MAVGRIISAKSQLPTLGNVLIAAENNRLRLLATNLEISINFWVGAKVEKEGGLLLPARTLAELVSSLPAEKVDLEATSEILKISCGSFQASLNGLPSGEFPPFPSLPEKTKTSFPLSAFLEAVSQVAFAAAQDEGRPILAGVKWLPGEGEISLASTDGYRLSVKKIPFKTTFLKDSLVIPSRALLEAAHLSQEKGKKDDGEELGIFLAPSENQIVFSLGEVEVASRLIEGEFPDFTKIIPSGFTSRAAIGKEELLRATRVAAVFARDSANIIRWKIDPSADGGKLTLSANSPQVGENISEIEAKIEGEAGEIAFNFRFLLDFLNAVKSEEIIFEMSGPLNPGVFKLSGDDSLLHIIMPVRVQG